MIINGQNVKRASTFNGVVETTPVLVSQHTEYYGDYSDAAMALARLYFRTGCLMAVWDYVVDGRKTGKLDPWDCEDFMALCRHWVYDDEKDQVYRFSIRYPEDVREPSVCVLTPLVLEGEEVKNA